MTGALCEPRLVWGALHRGTDGGRLRHPIVLGPATKDAKDAGGCGNGSSVAAKARGSQSAKGHRRAHGEVGCAAGRTDRALADREQSDGTLTLAAIARSTSRAWTRSSSRAPNAPRGR